MKDKINNQSHFKPTWLYIKTHNITGLNYLGQTCENDPVKYKGSGVNWNLHLNEFGNDVSTFIIGYYTDKDECKRIGVFFSWFYDIVKSKDWANLRYETLGWGGPHSEETKEKMKKSLQARTAAGLNPLSKRPDGTSIGLESALSRIKAKTHNFQKRPDGTSLMSDRIALGTGPSQTEEGKFKLKIAAKEQIKSGKHPSQIKIECDHCGKICSKNNHVQFHGDRCKQNPDRIIPKLRKLPEKRECPVCYKMVDPQNYSKSHGDKCKKRI